MTVGMLFAATACATPAAAEAEVSVQAASSDPAISANTVSETGYPPVAQENNMLTGKVITVSSDEITLALAVMTEKGGAPGGNGPGGGAPPSDSEGQAPESREERATKPQDGEIPSGSEPPAGMPGGGRGSGMNMEFSVDTTTYSVSSAVVVTKGMDDNEETISLEDLTADNVIRFEINDSNQITQIRLMEEDGGDQRRQPPSGESSSEE